MKKFTVSIIAAVLILIAGCGGPEKKLANQACDLVDQYEAGEISVMEVSQEFQKISREIATKDLDAAKFDEEIQSQCPDFQKKMMPGAQQSMPSRW